MKTEEIENELREVLRERAERITASDLPQAPSERSPVLGLSARQSATPWRAIAAAAVILVAVGVVGVGVLTRGAPTDEERLEQPATETGGGPASSSESPARAWPLTNDEPLPATANPDDLRTPEAAARAYLTQVVGLPDDWPIDVQTNGDFSGATYTLQDVRGYVSLERDAGGLWFVGAANTDFLRPEMPTSILAPADLSISPGPRMYEDGARVRLTALGADGRVLVTEAAEVPGPRTENEAAAAAVVSLQWDSREVMAAVRADVVDDHDGNPSTPDVTIGHWSTALPGPGIGGLPAAVNPATAAPIFSADGTVDDVAEAYMRSRFPDYPAPGIDLEPAFTRGSRAYVTWRTGQGGEQIAEGIVGLRQSGESWSVIAVITHDVDVSGLALAEGRISGRITTTNINSLFADVFQPDGTPAAGSPRPEGQPDAAYRFGTAGGPGDRSLDIDVPVEPGSALVRVNLVGGTILSITEFRMPVPQPGG